MPSAVLVAEPEPETREYLGRHLRDDGFDVLGAARRSEALELAERPAPTSCFSPSSTSACGFGAASRAARWDRNVPVIVPGSVVRSRSSVCWHSTGEPTTSSAVPLRTRSCSPGFAH